MLTEVNVIIILYGGFVFFFFVDLNIGGKNVVGMCYYSPVSYVLLYCSVYKSKGTRASHIHAELIQSDLIRSSLTQ